MKKVFLGTALLIFITTGFTSCKKDWSCSCTDQNGNTVSIPINNETLIDARSKCKDMNSSTGATSESCSLQ
jgi:hypothetical protein